MKSKKYNASWRYFNDFKDPDTGKIVGDLGEFNQDQKDISVKANNSTEARKLIINKAFNIIKKEMIYVKKLMKEGDEEIITHCENMIMTPKKKNINIISVEQI